MKIIVVGCGRVGSTLALTLVSQGHTVALIDKSRSAFDVLGAEFKGRTYVGLGFDDDLLRKAGIETADALIAVTGGDNSNLMTAQIARVKYGMTRVISRVKDPQRAQVYRQMGLNTYCGTLVHSGILMDALMGKPFSSIEEYLDLKPNETLHVDGERPASHLADIAPPQKADAPDPEPTRA